ncbi:MAG TPA: bestrophin family ion channel [Puia sp.]|nr:bestrophin family ion channel [Puia sp.]
MIIRKKEHWFRMLFIWRGSVISQLIPRLGLLLIVSILIVWFSETLFKYNIHLNPAPFTLFGIALALFLGFRNSASYDRFWEGRKLWGSLITTSRNLARQVHTLPTQIPDIRNTSLFVNYLIALAYTLKHQLRDTDPAADLDRLLTSTLATRVKAVRFKPQLLIREMAHWVQSARHHNHIDYISQQSIDSNLNQLTETIGGCERIAGTPIPYSYSVLLHRTVYVYCFLLPLGLVDSLGWMTPIIVVFIAYTYVALEAIADELENPFGLFPNDLALDTLCHSLENSLLEMDNRPLRPDPPTADPFILT